MKEDTKQCIKWIVIGVLWVGVICGIAFIMSIVGG